MSDRLVVEFYSERDSARPVACVLALYGGDNPSSAATTINDFLSTVAKQSSPRFDDSGLLAAKFIVWESARLTDSDSLDFWGIYVIPFQESYGYQVARIHSSNSDPLVYFVRDEWTKDQDLREAKAILGRRYLDSPMSELVPQ